MLKSDAFLAIDLGASSGRAIVGALAGGEITTTEVHRFRTPLVEDGTHLYWAIETIWEEVRRALENALQIAPRLRSVSIDSWAVDYVPLDASGTPLRRAYSYRDSRTKGRPELLLRQIDAQKLYGVTGTQFLPFNTLFQVLADVEDEPELVALTAMRLFIADYLLFRLSGIAAVERTMASTSQLYDVRSGSWSEQVISLTGDQPARWPRIVDPGTVLGPVRSELLPSGISPPLVIASCSHDTAAAVAAIPAASDEPWAFISSGTWSLVGAELPQPILTPAARLAGFTNEVGIDSTIRFLKNRTGTWILEECVREWSQNGDRIDWTLLMHEAASVQSPGFIIDCNESSFGERGEMQERIARACAALGKPVPQSRAALVRLVLESLADCYRETLAQLHALTGLDTQVLHVVGGGARNALLNQLTADACGCRVLAGPSEATALGNLLIQARALGCLPAGMSIRDSVRLSTDTTEYVPNNTLTSPRIIQSVHS